MPITPNEFIFSETRSHDYLIDSKLGDISNFDIRIRTCDKA